MLYQLSYSRSTPSFYCRYSSLSTHPNALDATRLTAQKLLLHTLFSQIMFT